MKRFFSLVIFFCLLLCSCVQQNPRQETEQVPAAVEDPYSASQWGGSAIHIESAWQRGLTGEGVTVAIIDTGVDSSHEDLQGAKILPGRNFSGCGGETDVGDQVGHGTFVAGILAAQCGNQLGIAGLAEDVSILPIKCMEEATGASLSAVISSVEYAVEQNADILILSLGMLTPAPELEQALQKAADRNVLIFAAVGNEGGNELYYPAAYDCVVGVGSVTESLKHASGSQVNQSVFVTAPGKSIFGPWTGEMAAVVSTGGGGYRRATGTSFAVPYAAAMGVIAKQIVPDISAAEFQELLQDSCLDLGEQGYDIEFGWGLVQADLLLDKLDKLPDSYNKTEK